jgi:hypothetical protein
LKKTAQALGEYPMNQLGLFNLSAMQKNSTFIVA